MTEVLSLRKAARYRVPVTLVTSPTPDLISDVVSHWMATQPSDVLSRLGSPNMESIMDDVMEKFAPGKNAAEEMAQGPLAPEVYEEVGQILRKDLDRAIENPKCQQILFEVGLDSDPVFVAESVFLNEELEERTELPYRLDTLVSVLDGPTLLKRWIEPGRRAYPPSDEQEAWTVSIESADRIVVMGLTQISEWGRTRIREALTLLNPRAEVFEWPLEDRSIHPLQPSGHFNWKLTLDGGTAFQALQGRELDAQIEASTFVYQRNRPFHPERLYQIVEDWPAQVLRTRGTAWVGMKGHENFQLSQLGPNPIIIAPSQEPEITPTNLAFVGKNLEFQALERILDACLLTDLEMRMDWSRFRNPFEPFLKEMMSEA
ncbi:MAG: GTP-binding protein [Bdellovibrionales bacterium]|nr:GTP-binding protein [Bdellovibrionales bacterium]